MADRGEQQREGVMSEGKGRGRRGGGEQEKAMAEEAQGHSLLRRQRRKTGGLKNDVEFMTY